MNAVMLQLPLGPYTFRTCIYWLATDAKNVFTFVFVCAYLKYLRPMKILCHHLFFKAKDVNANKMYCQISEVYVENTMSGVLQFHHYLLDFLKF